GFKSSSEVREIVESVVGTIQDRIRDLPKFLEVHRKDRRRFAELTGKIWKLAEDSLSSPYNPGVCWESAGSNSKEASEAC
ncbi:unnamed protein product, partial [Musa textilis]